MQKKNAVPMPYIISVRESAQQRALTLLAANPWRKLSQAEAHEFGIPPTLAAVNREPYLLRGLVLNPYAGSFEVFARNGDILVHHLSLGRKPLPMRRKSIVVLLEIEPKEIYVSVGLAE